MFSVTQLVQAEEIKPLSDDDDNKPIEVFISTKEEPDPLKLSLNSTLKLAVENNLNIALQKDKVKENKLKVDEVKNKKLLLFFKFANSSALENSAQYSLEASESRLKTTINNVITEASVKYYKLVEAILARNIADEFLKQGKLSLEQNEKLLKLGKATNFEVKQTEVFVESLKQKQLESQIAYMLSSVDLAQYLNQKNLNINIMPEECNLNSKNNASIDDIKMLNLVNETILLTECIEFALQNRPELEEIKYKIRSLEELKMATKSDEIKSKTIDSQISQLKKTLEMLENTVKATVTQALLKLIGSKNQIEVAKKKCELSIKALDQAYITRSEGFSTNKDVLDAQIYLAGAKKDLIKAIIAYNIAQIKLLNELGIIDKDIISKNTPLKLSNNRGSNKQKHTENKLLNSNVETIKQ
jgi:outer membrane protein TolC